MGYGDAGGDVLGEEQLLHRRLLWPELVQQLDHIPGDLAQAAGEGDTRRRGDDAVLEQPCAGAVGLHQPKADGRHAGIDA